MRKRWQVLWIVVGWCVLAGSCSRAPCTEEDRRRRWRSYGQLRWASIATVYRDETASWSFHIYIIPVFLSHTHLVRLSDRQPPRTAHTGPTARTLYGYRRGTSCDHYHTRPLSRSGSTTRQGIGCPISRGRLACAARPFPMSSTAGHTNTCASTTCRSSRLRSSGPRSTPAPSVRHASLEGGVADDRAMSPPPARRCTANYRTRRASSTTGCLDGS